MPNEIAVGRCHRAFPGCQNAHVPAEAGAAGGVDTAQPASIKVFYKAFLHRLSMIFCVAGITMQRTFLWTWRLKHLCRRAQIFNAPVRAGADNAWSMVTSPQSATALALSGRCGKATVGGISQRSISYVAVYSASSSAV